MCTPVSAGEMLIDVDGNVMINIEMSVFIDVGVFCIICSTHSGTISCALLSFPFLICVVNVCDPLLLLNNHTLQSHL